jgi:hypothetical protein
LKLHPHHPAKACDIDRITNDDVVLGAICVGDKSAGRKKTSSIPMIITSHKPLTTWTNTKPMFCDYDACTTAWMVTDSSKESSNGAMGVPIKHSDRKKD